MSSEPEAKPDGNVHTMPNWGRPHIESQECWCMPRRDGEVARHQPNGIQLWVHNLEE